MLLVIASLTSIANILRIPGRLRPPAIICQSFNLYSIAPMTDCLCLCHRVCDLNGHRDVLFPFHRAYLDFSDHHLFCDCLSAVSPCDLARD